MVNFLNLQRKIINERNLQNFNHITSKLYLYRIDLADFMTKLMMYPFPIREQQKTRKHSNLRALNTRLKLKLEQTIHTVQSRDTIRLGHGWIVKRGFNKVLNGIVWTIHDCLTNMNNFRCIITKAMHT